MTTRSRRKYVQLALDRARKPDGKHGGWRPGAGRKNKPGAVSHATRPMLAPRFPQHVTLRLVGGVESIAREWLLAIIRRAIRESHKPTFRIVEFNVLSNHMHLVTEAHDEDALARGMQGLAVRLARRLNSALKRRGKLFAQRFHARYLRTPREVRNALRYVLLNRKHHAAERRFASSWMNPCSSAAWFDGWKTAVRADMGWKRALVDAPRPTAAASVWLLTTGWRRYGPIGFDEASA